MTGGNSTSAALRKPILINSGCKCFITACLLQSDTDVVIERKAGITWAITRLSIAMNIYLSPSCDLLVAVHDLAVDEMLTRTNVEIGNSWSCRTTATSRKTRSWNSQRDATRCCSVSSRGMRPRLSQPQRRCKDPAISVNRSSGHVVDEHHMARF